MYSKFTTLYISYMLLSFPLPCHTRGTGRSSWPWVWAGWAPAPTPAGCWGAAWPGGWPACRAAWTPAGTAGTCTGTACSLAARPGHPDVELVEIRKINHHIVLLSSISLKTATRKTWLRSYLLTYFFRVAWFLLFCCRFWMHPFKMLAKFVLSLKPSTTLKFDYKR